MASARFFLSTVVPETPSTTPNGLLDSSCQTTSKFCGVKNGVFLRGSESGSSSTVSVRGKFGASKSLPQLHVVEGWKTVGVAEEDGRLSLGSTTDWSFPDFPLIRGPMHPIHNEEAAVSTESDAARANSSPISSPTTSLSMVDASRSGLLFPYDLLRASGSVAGLQTPPPPRQKQESEHKDDYYVNVGYAIRSLREELPSLFYKELTYDIYRDDITFRDPLNTFSGINNYKLIFWALRFHGRIFFKALWVDVVQIWQPCDKVIMIRWSVKGMPRVPWEAQGHFDGTSEYKLDKEGKIYEHKVDNVVMNGYKNFKLVSVWEAILNTRTTASPTFYFSLHRLFKRISPYVFLFTWVRFYCALAGTMALKKNLQLSSGNCQ